ncbi:hypothetical protein [Tateyamaria sp. SN6-1]|uniref:hypothetical protein n=1 Tax=Tateyamaria sp. SN6-1 TaxID=3092148 RepID=UPI0039F5F300
MTRLTPDMLAASLLPGVEDPDLSRAARQPVADPLWMLLRQAQFGEFAAQDAGSPAMVRIEGTSNTFTATRTGNEPPRPYDPRLAPLEPLAEGDPDLGIAAQTDNDVPGGLPPLAQVRVSWGLDAMRVLRAHGLSAAARRALVALFPLKDPDWPHSWGATVAPSAPHAAVHGASGLDGVKLSDAMSNAHPRNLLDGLPEGLEGAAQEALADALMDWKQSLPQGAHAAEWSPETLTAELEVLTPQGSAPARVLNITHPGDFTPIGGGLVLPDEILDVVVADEGSILGGLGDLFRPTETATADVLHLEGYAGGRIDWWHLRAAPSETLPKTQIGAPAPALDQVVVPTEIAFPGMPANRMWSVEPPDQHFGDLDPGPEDLARLVVAEFAVTGAEGWMLAPLTVLRGSYTQVETVHVRDVFGREEPRRVQRPAPDDPFDFGGISGAPGALVMLPALPLVQIGPKREEVSLRRDPAARLVWGIEERAPAALTGLPTDGAAAHAAQPPAPEPARGPTPAAYAYRIATPVPAHWVPFTLPPEDDPTAPRILRLAALLDTARDAAPPLTGNILRSLPGLADEAVPPEGVRLERAARRIRWVGGGVRSWIGRQRPHRVPGAGQSGLRYDTLSPLTGPERRPAPDPQAVSLRDVMNYADGATGGVSDLMQQEDGTRAGSVRATLLAMARRRSDPS